jgi:predicted transcriptional regulator of viral defense system
MIEQAMQWLIEHGPVVVRPPLPVWTLKRLVASKRILRLRRDVYLAPRPDGNLPPPAAVAGLLAPEGYLSFYGALALHGLTDQEASSLAVVTPARQSSVRYGSRTIEFYASPRPLNRAKITTKDFGGVFVRLATPAQALVDSLEVRRLGGGVRELLNILRVALSGRLMTVNEVVELVVALGSAAVARRLGLLLELADAKAPDQLREMSKKIHEPTMFDPHRAARVKDSVWNLQLPASRQEILRSTRDL